MSNQLYIFHSTAFAEAWVGEQFDRKCVNFVSRAARKFTTAYGNECRWAVIARPGDFDRLRGEQFDELFVHTACLDAWSYRFGEQTLNSLQALLRYPGRGYRVIYDVEGVVP